MTKNGSYPLDILNKVIRPTCFNIKLQKSCSHVLCELKVTFEKIVAEMEPMDFVLTKQVTSSIFLMRVAVDIL